MEYYGNVQEFVPAEDAQLAAAEAAQHHPVLGYSSVSSVLVDGGHSFAITGVSFDDYEELLWDTNAGGHATCYFGPALEKHTSFQVFQNEEVRNVATCSAGALFLGKVALKCNNRQGLSAFSFSSKNMLDMQSMLQLREGMVVLGGYQQSIVFVDLEKLTESQVIPITEQDCTIMRVDETKLYTGDTTGKVTIRDIRSARAVNTFDAHVGTLSDFDVCGNNLVTCGFSMRNEELACDRFLMTYDVRMQRAMPPVVLNFEPMFYFRNEELACDRFLMTYDVRMQRAMPPVVVNFEPMFYFRNEELACDRFLMTYDVRMQRAMPPVVVNFEPMFYFRNEELACDRFLMTYDVRMQRAMPPVVVNFEPMFYFRNEELACDRFLMTYDVRMQRAMPPVVVNFEPMFYFRNEELACDRFLMTYDVRMQRAMPPVVVNFEPMFYFRNEELACDRFLMTYDVRMQRAMPPVVVNFEPMFYFRNEELACDRFLMTYDVRMQRAMPPVVVNFEPMFYFRNEELACDRFLMTYDVRMQRAMPPVVVNFEPMFYFRNEELACDRFLMTYDVRMQRAMPPVVVNFEPMFYFRNEELACDRFLMTYDVRMQRAMPPVVVNFEPMFYFRNEELACDRFLMTYDVRMQRAMPPVVVNFEPMFYFRNEELACDRFLMTYDVRMQRAMPPVVVNFEPMFYFRNEELACDRFLMTYDVRMQRAMPPVVVNFEPMFYFRNEELACDRFLMTYDVRMQRAMPPVVVNFEPMFYFRNEELACDRFLMTYDVRMQRAMPPVVVNFEPMFYFRNEELACDRFLMTYDVRMQRAMPPVVVNFEPMFYFRNEELACDRFLMTYDVRMQRAMPPVVVNFEPMFYFRNEELACDRFLMTYDVRMQRAMPPVVVNFEPMFYFRNEELACDRFLMTYDVRMQRAMPPVVLNFEPMFYFRNEELACDRFLMTYDVRMQRAMPPVVVNFEPMFYFRNEELACDRFLMTYDVRMQRAMPPVVVNLEPMFYFRNEELACDRFLMTYDVRMQRAMPPVVLNFEPMFLRFLPVFSSRRLVVASHTGEFQVMEIGEPSSLMQHIAPDTNAGCMGLDVSSTKHAIAFADNAGCLHLFADQDVVLFNAESNSTVFADVVQPPPVSINFDDEFTPLSLVPLPIPNGKLSSDWPDELCQYIYRKPLPINPLIFNSMKMVDDFVGYAPNPGLTRRNQVPYDLRAQRMPAKSVNIVFDRVPKLYRKVHYKRNRFGTDEFDYKSFNATEFAGLEVATANAHGINCLLLALFHTQAVKDDLRGHLCQREFCLACEMSFVFDNLEKSAGSIPVPSTSFVRAFRSIQEAVNLRIVLDDREDLTAQHADLVSLTQHLLRFLLKQVAAELADTSKSVPSPLFKLQRSLTTEGQVTDDEDAFPAPVSQKGAKGEDSAFLPGVSSSPTTSSKILDEAFSFATGSKNVCKCGKEHTRTDSAMVVTLQYPYEGQPLSFAGVMDQSLNRRGRSKSYCDQCLKYEQHYQETWATSAPKIFVVTSAMNSQRELDYWTIQDKHVTGSRPESPVDPGHSTKPCRYGSTCNRANCRFFHPNAVKEVAASWLPEQIRASMDDVRLRILDDGQGGVGTMTYRLKSVVFAVRPNSSVLPTHSVVCIRDSDYIHSTWLLYNDIAVTRVAQNEVFKVRMEYKVPVAMFFERSDVSWYTEPKPSPITWIHLVETESLALRRRLSSSTCVPLDEDELPKKDHLVAIDAEFVSLNAEESEIRTDGSRTVFKASQMSVARVSCIRGGGPLEGAPFIDDYVSTQEAIADYLTEVSGIRPGDLDKARSSKHLTTLKTTYLKLRYMVDMGVVFLGHGLRKDFDVINIVVPPDQIRDTVVLYHLPGHRMISLRFLAFKVLGLKIQSSHHDSVEDAQTAHKLYKNFKDLTVAERETLLSGIYDEGERLGWMVPDS